MTRNQFKKSRFGKGDYVYANVGNGSLLAVDFERYLFGIERGCEVFWAACENCKVMRPKLKAEKSPNE